MAMQDNFLYKLGILAALSYTKKEITSVRIPYNLVIPEAFDVGKSCLPH